MDREATSRLVARTIRALTAEWLAEGVVPTVRAIGDGMCEEFANEVLDRIHATDPATIDVVTAAFTDDWWLRETDGEGRDLGSAVSFEADVDRLRREGAPLPDDVPDAELSLLIGAATHMWIVHDGMHHDATAPDGAEHFLLMPFFADQVAGHRNDASRPAIA
jgi:hypothetical protein